MSDVDREFESFFVGFLHGFILKTLKLTVEPVSPEGSEFRLLPCSNPGGFLVRLRQRLGNRGHDPVKYFQVFFFEGARASMASITRPFESSIWLEDQADIHGGLLGLTLAPAVDAMLPDQRQGVGQDVEGSSQPPPYRTHLKLVSFAGFGIVFQHGLVP